MERDRGSQAMRACLRVQEDADAVSPSNLGDPPEAAEAASPSTPDFVAIQLEALQLSRELSASPASALASSSEKAASEGALVEAAAGRGARPDMVAGAGTPLDFSAALHADTPGAQDETSPGEHFQQHLCATAVPNNTVTPALDMAACTNTWLACVLRRGLWWLFRGACGGARHAAGAPGAAP